MMKTKLLLSFLLLNLNFSLEATIVETIIFENPKNKVEVALFGSVHDEKGAWQFPWICQAILHAKEPLLVLCEDDDSKLRKSSRTLNLRNAAEIEKFILTQALMTDDIILDKIRALHVYNYFPPSVTYQAVDNRIFSKYAMKLKEILKPLERNLMRWWWFKMQKPEALQEMVTKTVDRWKTHCHYVFYCLLASKAISFDKKFKDPSIEQLLLAIELEIQLLKKRTVPSNIKDFYLGILKYLEVRYCELQKYCREIVTEEEFKMPLSNYIVTNFIAGNWGKIKKLTHICDDYYMDYFHRILDVEVLYRVYTTNHPRIALFAGANHVRYLATCFQALGWRVAHKTMCDYKNGVPSSDFDFLK